MTFSLTGTYIQMADFYNHDNIYLNIKNFFLRYIINMQKKMGGEQIIFDTFTLQEIEKDMRMYVHVYICMYVCIWVEVNRYHRKPEEGEEERA